MLFETQIVAPTSSGYGQHRFLERLFATFLEEAQSGRSIRAQSNYIWCEIDGMLRIRRRLPTEDLPWYPLDVPSAGSMINFQVQTVSRGGHRVSKPFNGPRRGGRKALDNPLDLLRWLDREAARYGMRIEHANVEVDERQCDVRNKPVLSTRERSSFTLTTARFVGVATVLDALAFEQALACGIGTGKAYGFGFLIFSERRRSDGTPTGQRNLGPRQAAYVE